MDSNLTYHEILNAIQADLTGDALEYWRGRNDKDKTYCVYLVQRRGYTVAELQEKIKQIAHR